MAEALNKTDLVIVGQPGQTVVGNNVLLEAAGIAGTDVSGFNSFTVQVISSASGGTFVFEASNDGVNYQSTPTYNQALQTPTVSVTSITASVSQIIYVGACPFKYIRLRIATTITGGTIQAVSTFSTTILSATQTMIAQGAAGNLNVNVSGATIASIAAGQTAHSSPSTGAPLRVGGRVAPITIATVDTTLAAGDATENAVTTAMQAVIKPFSPSELDITIPVLPGVTTTTAQSILGASGTASVRNYITGLTLQTDTLGAAGTMFVVDGQGAIGTSVTIATPGVFTSSTHDLRVGDAIIFTSLGSITGITVNTVYYITATTFAATTFTVALTPGGTAVQITGGTSAFTFYRVFHVFRLPTTAITSPVQVKFDLPLKCMANVASNILIPVTLTSGAIYLTVNGYRGF